MNIRMLTTVEDQVTAFADSEAADTPAPLNAIAAQRGAMMSRKASGEIVTLNWHMPEGGEFAVGDRQGNRLVGLGYAEAI